VPVTDSPAPLPAVTAADRAPSLRDRLVVLAGDRRLRYIATGGLSAVIFYALFSAGWVLTGGRVPYLVMSVLVNLLTGLLTYPVYARVVFRATTLSVIGFLRFYLLCLLSLAWAFVGLPILVEIAHLPVLVAVPIVILAAPLLNYQIMKFWTFRHRAGA
jgi:putative flippase GtrA